MFPMSILGHFVLNCPCYCQPMEKPASISANFQKSSKVSIYVALFQVLKDLAEISASLGLSGE